MGDRAHLLGDRGDPLLEAGHQRHPSLWHTERLCHVVGFPARRLPGRSAPARQGVGGSRARPASERSTSCRLTAQTSHCAWVMMTSRLQRLQHVVVDAVDGESLPQDSLDLAVDLPTRSARVDQGLSADAGGGASTAGGRTRASGRRASRRSRGRRRSRWHWRSRTRRAARARGPPCGQHLRRRAVCRTRLAWTAEASWRPLLPFFR